jgi:hypothetical protein
VKNVSCYIKLLPLPILACQEEHPNNKKEKSAEELLASPLMKRRPSGRNVVRMTGGLCIRQKRNGPERNELRAAVLNREIVRPRQRPTSFLCSVKWIDFEMFTEQEEVALWSMKYRLEIF